jgi:hypothetical protein
MDRATLQSLRKQALILASQLPDDPAEAAAVLLMMQDLLARFFNPEPEPKTRSCGRPTLNVVS